MHRKEPAEGAAAVRHGLLPHSIPRGLRLAAAPPMKTAPTDRPPRALDMKYGILGHGEYSSAARSGEPAQRRRGGLGASASNCKKPTSVTHVGTQAAKIRRVPREQTSGEKVAWVRGAPIVRTGTTSRTRLN